MAEYNGSPQVEDGYTKIANELLDKIINIDFTKRQYKILLTIIRKTYGFNKTSDDISRTQIVELTGLKNPHVTTTIQELLTMNVLIVDSGKYAKNYRINKYYDTWRITETVTITKTVTITETVTDSYQNGNNSLPKQYPQKTTTKENTKENIAITLKTYLDNCKQENKKAIPDNSIVFKNAEKLKIPEELIHLCWLKFKDSHIEKKKKYKDWESAFNNCVKDNWYKIWFKDSEGNLVITSQGRLIKDYFYG